MRARVWKSGRTWYYEVFEGDRVLVSDNTNDWRVILNEADECVRAFARVRRTGHTFGKTWSELVFGS